MRAFAVARVIFFTTLSLVSLIVFCVGVHICIYPTAHLSNDGEILPLPQRPSDSSNPFANPGSDPSIWDMLIPDARNLPVATSVITLIIVVPLLFFNCLAKNRSWNRFLGRVWLELCWSAMLSVLWLASATLVTLFSKFTSLANTPSFGLYCGNCWQVSLLNGCTWVAWGITFGYFIALIGCFIASVPEGGKSEDMVIGEVLVPRGDVEGVKLSPNSAPNAHPPQQYPPVVFPYMPQEYVPQPYAPQPYAQPIHSNPVVSVVDVPSQEVSPRQ